MRPAVKRRLATLAVAVSLMLCVLTVGLWVRSYWVWDQLVCTLRLQQQPKLIKRTELNSNRGSLRLSRQSIGLWSRQPNLPPVGRSQWQLASTASYGDSNAGITGFMCRIDRTEAFESGLPRNFAIVLPLWIPALAFGAFPVALASRRLHSRIKKRARACAGCGYDLRATPERCPECGAAPAGTNRAIGVR